MAQASPPAPDAEVELGELARVAITLDEDGQAGEAFGQTVSEPHAMPAGQVRRVEQGACRDPQRPADGDAQHGDAAPGLCRAPESLRDAGRKRRESFVEGARLLRLPRCRCQPLFSPKLFRRFSSTAWIRNPRRARVG